MYWFFIVFGDLDDSWLTQYCRNPPTESDFSSKFLLALENWCLSTQFMIYLTLRHVIISSRLDVIPGVGANLNLCGTTTVQRKLCGSSMVQK